MFNNDKSSQSSPNNELKENNKILLNHQNFLLNLEVIIKQIKDDPKPAIFNGLENSIIPQQIIQILNSIQLHYKQIMPGLSFNNPLRFGKGELDNNPVTFHLLMNKSERVYLFFDPNSKKSVLNKIDEDKKNTGVKQKIIGKGGQKKIRRVWLLDFESQSFKVYAASIYNGKAMIDRFEETKSLYEESTFLINMLFGAKYLKNSIPKAIAFTPLARGSWYNLCHEFHENFLDLNDVLWVYYSSIYSLASFHKSGKLHRDVKLENFLFFRTPYGIDLSLIDLDMAIFQKNANNYAEVVDPLYYAFDRPLFNPLLEIHNALIEVFESNTLENINIPLKSEFEEALLIYNKSKEQKIDVITAKKLALKNFMDGSFLKEFLKKRLPYNGTPSIWNNEKNKKIIFSTLEKIPMNRKNDPKDDVWSLCMALHIFYNKIEINWDPIPELVLKLNEIIIVNLIRVREDRLSAENLLEEIENLIKDKLISKICQEKFNDHVRYHKLEPFIFNQSIEVECKSEMNTESQEKFVSFCNQIGYTPSSSESNGENLSNVLTISRSEQENANQKSNILAQQQNTSQFKENVPMQCEKNNLPHQHELKINSNNFFNTPNKSRVIQLKKPVNRSIFNLCIDQILKEKGYSTDNIVNNRYRLLSGRRDRRKRNFFTHSPYGKSKGFRKI